MKTTLMLRRLRVELLHALVIRRLAAGQIRQPFAVHDRPVVLLLHPADVVAAAGAGTSVLSVKSTAVSLRLRSMLLQVLEHAQVAPQAFARAPVA